MPAFGRDEILQPVQIDDVTEYVVRLSGRPADAAMAGRGGEVFAMQCVACHGAQGRGDPRQGAPNLTDREWLYGSSRQAIRDQIVNGRGGVMPAWSYRSSQSATQPPFTMIGSVEKALVRSIVPFTWA